MMDRLLRVGDVFRLPAELRLHGLVRWPDNNTPPVMSFDDLHIADSFEPDTNECRWTETKEGGWKRSVSTPLSRVFTGELPAGWVVIETEMTGGGIGHGPYDIYPDGHRVTARPVESESPILRFYQSGCFMGMLAPKDVELLPQIPVVPCERVDGQDAYLVSGGSISRVRDGRVEVLEGAERERAARWIVRNAATAVPLQPPGDKE